MEPVGWGPVSPSSLSSPAPSPPLSHDTQTSIRDCFNLLLTLMYSNWKTYGNDPNLSVRSFCNKHKMPQIKVVVAVLNSAITCVIVTGVLTVRDAGFLKHGLKGLVGLCKGGSFRRVPLPAWERREQEIGHV